MLFRIWNSSQLPPLLIQFILISIPNYGKAKIVLKIGIVCVKILVISAPRHEHKLLSQSG